MVGEERNQPRERLLSSSEVPLLVFEQEGRPDKPLVVFLPGAIHLARIAYGHGSARPEDFLAHWWNEAGYPFLAVSYPLEVAEAAFETVDPDLGLAAYADAVAAHVDDLVGEWGLERRVIVLGWSAAGNLAPRLNVELANRGVALELFVAIAATPPIPGLIFGSLDATADWATSRTSFTESGLLAHAGLRSFLSELERTDRRYGRIVIAESDYTAHYLGNMPLNLFPGLDVQRVSGELVVGQEGPLAESRGTVWAEYPVVAALQPTWSTDARHAVTDRFNWGFVQTNMLSATRLANATVAGLTDAEWRRRSALVGSAPDRLTRVIEGGHMFFVGIDGARETVAAVLDLLDEAEAILAEFEQPTI